MLKKTPYILVLGLFLLSFSTVSLAEKGKVYYLVGNLKEIKGEVDGQGTVFQGQIGFRVVLDQKGQLTLSLHRLSLVSKGVTTARGNSGVIGLVLADPEAKVSYDWRTGQLAAEFRSTLHYELIDKIKGYRPVKEHKECAVFIPYTEEMVGRLIGRLPEKLQPAPKGSVSFDGELTMGIRSWTVKAIRIISIEYLQVEKGLIVMPQPAELLRIQPVFIGSGFGDPNRTGTSFPDLWNRAEEIWNRCGTVRCIRLVSNQPKFVNNDNYRVLNSLDEARDLRAEVDVLDAVEVFMVDRWDPLYDGGGACWSSGTASAKIVTCDQQLDVPSTDCPASFGDVNYYHLAHELGHALNLAHPPGPTWTLAASTVGSVMELSGWCADNPDVQSAKNCRNASNPLLYWGPSVCTGSPDIMD